MNKRVLSVMLMMPAGLAGFFLAEGGMSQKAGGAEAEIKPLTVVQGPVEADVLKVVDGDTVRVSAYPWPDAATVKDVRIRGIDTAETHGKCQYEKDMAAAAKSFVTDMVNKNKGRVKLTVIGCNQAEGAGFGRCLATVSVGPVTISSALIEKGLARTNMGEKRQPWCPTPP
jgi:endonuclease YncB( thermonuclease family)